MSRANDHAFPIPSVTGLPNGHMEYGAPGLTIREHAVIEMAKAIIGTAAAPCLTSFQGCEPAIAVTAARMADALIAELAKPVTP